MTTGLPIAHLTSRGAAPDARAPREDALAAVIGLWAVAGLMLDGRAHETGSVESFFTPWHAVLYSGVAAAFVAIAALAARRRRAGSPWSSALPDGYGLSLLGVGVMAVAGAGDMAWHEIFGIEEDLAALLSPTHLLLLIGGLLLLTAPVRRALARGTSGWTGLAPAVVSAMLTATTIAFFLEFASPFHDAGIFAGGGGHGGPELGVAGVVITTVVLLGAIALLHRRLGRLPFGAATLIFTGTVALLSVAADFAVGGGGIAAAVVGGVVADVLLGRAGAGRALGLPIALALTAVILWAAFFGIVAAFLTLSWDTELWTGAVVLAALTGYGLGLLAGGDAHDQPAVAS